MRILNKKKLLFSIIFSVFIFLISIFILKKIINSAIEENASEQLMNANKQNMEVAQVKIKTILDAKIDIFIENLLDSHVIEEEIVDSEQLVELLKYYRKENFIATLGVVVGDRAVFIDENDQVIKIDRSVLESILVNKKSIFKFLINGEENLVVKNTLNDGNRQDITVIYLHKDKTENKDLLIPVYTEEGFSYVIDNDGQNIFYSTKEKSEVDLVNLFDKILSFSQDNLDAVNTARIDIINKKSGVVRYEKPGDEGRWMSYAPLEFEDLYLCTIIPDNMIEKNVDEIKNLNEIFMIVILVDIVLLIVFFKFLEFNEKNKENKILNVDCVTKGNSYKKFQEEFKKFYSIENEKKAIYMAIDIDNFKVVNTVLGKETGDQALKKIYELIKFYVGDKGCYCRKNADKFLAYYEYEDSDDIDYVVNSISTGIRNLRMPRGHILIPSIGIYYIKNNKVGIDDVEIKANIARKKSKNKINEFYSYFADKNFEKLIDNKNIVDDMNNAIKNKEFKLVYQPKFDAKTNKVVGAEALIRWRKSDNSTVFPSEFIPVAEKTGFITFIDSYVFREICEKQAEWIKKGYDIVPISINVSREKIKDQHFLYEYLKIIGEFGLKKEYIQLEITEGDTYSYDNVQSNIVDLIKDSGFKVLIDDFGVGYSSLTMLKNIKADFLKLDRSFIIDESSEGKAMVKYIAKIAKIFNYRIIAEGVETEDQYNYIKEYCDEIQGYYFSKPLEEEVFVNQYLKA